MSPNGQYKACMQLDGNLVVYFQSPQLTTVLWNTNTGGNPGANLKLQVDANLVIYSSTGVAKWSSAVTGSYTQSSLSLQVYEYYLYFGILSICLIFFQFLYSKGQTLAISWFTTALHLSGLAAIVAKQQNLSNKLYNFLSI
jgi:hypothetical protein